MANLLCLVVGHKPTRVPFSSTRVYCGRCGLDLRGHGATAKGPAVPPPIGKQGVGAASRHP
jgi:hypothetical protein